MGSEYPIPHSDRYLVLLNPNAAGGQRDVLRRRIAGAMASHHVPFDIVESTSVEDGLRVVRTAVELGCKAVVAAGGDGTIALALRGTAGSEVPVALLPFGTGNQLALNFGVPVSLEDSVRVAVEGVVERIDLGRIGDEYFALIAGAGLDAEVMASATSELKNRLGVLAYLVGGLKHVVTPSRTQFRIVADDEEIEVEASMVLLANAGIIGAGGLPVELKVAPRTSFQDGLLDIAIFSPRHLPDMAAMLTRVVFQRYAGDDRMVFLQARKITVESDPPVSAQIDGEPRGETPIVAQIEPLAGRILVPG
ncbi:MAG: diacylglycerol kinase family lipid kinase [marine benthic group bacterium]|nr:diacylglycerol kinase family lipid kinase [Candidatus Benthicola marisminoris]